MSVWHSDRFGRNDFLGEVMLPLGNDTFESSGLKWYPLQERVITIFLSIVYYVICTIVLWFVTIIHSSHNPKHSYMKADVPLRNSNW